MFWLPNITTIIIAWVLECIILGGYVWFEKFNLPGEEYQCWLVRGARALAFISMTTLSFLLIETDLKIFLGVMGYGNFFQHLASVLLTLILSIQIIIGTVLTKPNLKGIITFGSILSSFLIFILFLIPAQNSNQINVFGDTYSALEMSILIPVLIGIIVSAVISLLEMLLYKRKEELSFFSKPIWDIQHKIKKIFSLRFNLILYALITTELLLNLQGLSLLLWLTMFF